MDPVEPQNALRELVRIHGLEHVVTWVLLGANPPTAKPAQLLKLESEYEEQIQCWLMEIACAALPGILESRLAGPEESKG